MFDLLNGVVVVAIIVCAECVYACVFFFFQAEDGIRDLTVTGVQTCALPISFVTSRVRGVTRRSGWVKGWRVPANTRFAPRFKASSTSARPIPRLAPVTRTTLSAIFIRFVPSPEGICRRSVKYATSWLHTKNPGRGMGVPGQDRKSVV